MKKYKVYVTDATYEMRDGVCEWRDGKVDSKLVEQHDTVQECFDSMNEWGSRWVMWPSVQIRNEEGEDVWSSIALQSKCDCCGHEEYDNVVDGLYTMKNKDGTKLFPAIV